MCSATLVKEVGEGGSDLTLGLLKPAAGGAATPAPGLWKDAAGRSRLTLDKVALLCPGLCVSQLLPDPAGLGGAGGDSDLLEKKKKNNVQAPPLHPAGSGPTKCFLRALSTPSTDAAQSGSSGSHGLGWRRNQSCTGLSVERG